VKSWWSNISTPTSGAIRLLGQIIGAADQLPNVFPNGAWINARITEGKDASILAGRAMKVALRTNDNYGNHEYAHSLWKEHGASALKDIIAEAISLIQSGQIK
jgi:hypothetical protein